MPTEKTPNNTYSIMDRVLLKSAKDIHEAVLDSYETYYDFTSGTDSNMTLEEVNQKLTEAIERVSILRKRFVQSLETTTEKELIKVAYQYGYGQDIESFKDLGKTFRERTLKALKKLKEAA